MSTRQLPSRCSGLALLTVFSLLLGCAPQGQGLVVQNPASDRGYFIDFETVVNGELATHIFELKNTDSTAIQIQDLTPSCSCTTPRISYLDAQGKRVRGRQRETPLITIPAGVTAELEVEIDTNHVLRKNTDKLAMVVLRCDSKNRAYMSFEMHLIASQAYQVTPKIMNLGDIPISSGSRSTVNLIKAQPDSSYRVLGVASQSEGLEVTIEEETLPGGILWRVQAVLSPPLALGPWKGEFALRSTDAEGLEPSEPFVVKVIGHVVGDVVLFPAALGLDRQDSDRQVGGRGVLTALAAGHRVRVADTLIQGDVPEGIEVQCTPQAPDANGKSGRWDVILEVNSLQPVESFAGTLQITLADPSEQVIEAKFIYRR